MYEWLNTHYGHWLNEIVTISLRHHYDSLWYRYDLCQRDFSLHFHNYKIITISLRSLIRYDIVMISFWCCYVNSYHFINVLFSSFLSTTKQIDLCFLCPNHTIFHHHSNSCLLKWFGMWRVRVRMQSHNTIRSGICFMLRKWSTQVLLGIWMQFIINLLQPPLEIMLRCSRTPSTIMKFMHGAAKVRLRCIVLW